MQLLDPAQASEWFETPDLTTSRGSAWQRRVCCHFGKICGMVCV